jgi:hypothetical protein
LCRPSTDFFLPDHSRSVIAGLDPAIHAMTVQSALRKDFTRSPLQLRQFF